MKGKQLRSNLLRIGLSLFTLALVLWTVGWRDVLAVLRAAEWRLLGLAWLLFLVGIVIRTYRWRALLHGLGLRPPLLQLLRLYLVGGFFNAFLPTGFGGDVVRVLELTQDAAADDLAAAVGTVLVDRLTGILSLLALGLLVLPFTPALPSWILWTLALVCVGGLLGGALLLEGRLLRRLTSRLPGSLALVGEGKLAQVYAAITGCGPHAIGEALALSTLFNLFNIAIYWLCALAVGIPIGLGFYFVATPLLSLTLLVPISVAGLGVRDAVALALYTAAGIPAELSAGMSLSVYAVTAAAGLIGGALYLVRALREVLTPRR